MCEDRKRNLAKKLEAISHEMIREEDSRRIHRHSFKFVIIGDSSVGKSCLLNRVMGEDFKEDQEATIEARDRDLRVELEHGAQDSIRSV